PWPNTTWKRLTRGSACGRRSMLSAIVTSCIAVSLAALPVTAAATSNKSSQQTGIDDQPLIVLVRLDLPRPAAGDQVEVPRAAPTEDPRQGSVCEAVAVQFRHHKAPFDSGTISHVDAVPAAQVA